VIDVGGYGSEMSKDELRVDLILEIVHRLGTAVGCKFEKEFYLQMMRMKVSGINLWTTDGEENFYKELCGE
jgi:hypothetical protein